MGCDQKCRGYDRKDPLPALAESIMKKRRGSDADQTRGPNPKYPAVFVSPAA